MGESEKSLRLQGLFLCLCIDCMGWRGAIRHGVLVSFVWVRWSGGLTGDFARVWRDGQGQYWVVAPFGLHSCLRQSGGRFATAFFRGAEAPRSHPKATARTNAPRLILKARCKAKLAGVTLSAFESAKDGAPVWLGLVWGGRATATAKRTRTTADSPLREG